MLTIFFRILFSLARSHKLTATESLRRQFLQQQYTAVKAMLIHNWASDGELETAF